MGTRTTRLLVLVGIAVLALVAAAAAILAAGDHETASRPEYKAAVTNARDRVDFALGRVAEAKTLEGLLERMDEAASAIDDAADDVNGKNPPAGFETEHERLTRGLRQLSDDLQGTAAQAREPGYVDLLLGAEGLSFDGWDDANAALRALRKKGLSVPLLSRQRTS